MKSTSIDEKITIRKFDLTSILSDSICVCIGKRRSGKSFLTREIMYEMARRGMPSGMIFSHTEHCNKFFRYYFPGLYVHEDMPEEKLAAILHSQHKKIKKFAKKYNVENGRNIKNSFFLLADDMMSDDDIWKKSRSFKKIFTEGRWANLFFIMSLQYVLGIPPALRSNIDYAFLFACDAQNDMKKLWENYASVIPTFDMFKKIFFECTRDYGCLVINRVSTSADLRDKVFYYKADPRGPPPFRFGSKSFWKLHDETYVSSDDDDDDENDERKRRLRRTIETYGSNGQRYQILIG
jgi:hypothetical protein